jgi:hypothetical protein
LFPELIQHSCGIFCKVGLALVPHPKMAESAKRFLPLGILGVKLPSQSGTRKSDWQISKLRDTGDKGHKDSYLAHMQSSVSVCRALARSGLKCF